MKRTASFTNTYPPTLTPTETHDPGVADGIVVGLRGVDQLLLLHGRSQGLS